MEYIKIKAISETDFDDVVTAAGGERIPDDSSADYILNEAVVELKLVLEEGFEKENRREKVADIFRKQQPSVPVVVINPEILDASGMRDYYNVVSGPIKTHVKKAASQLDATRLRINPGLVRVLVIINVGYTALSDEEFKRICIKCVHNDTSRIDWIVCGGIYLYSDKFDHYAIAPLEGVAVDVTKPFPGLTLLQDAWGKMLDKMMSPMAWMPASSDEGRMPVLDLAFDLKGVRYVKTSPTMPESSFWPSGRAPRENSTGLTTCPPVAKTFPALSEPDWHRFKSELCDNHRLQGSYRQWMRYQCEKDEKHDDKLKPFVPILIGYENFVEWVNKPKRRWLFADLCQFAVRVFQNKVTSVLDGAREKDEVVVIPLSYIHAYIYEIGTDQANDMTSILHVSDVIGFERKEVLVDHARIFFEHGTILACAYALKYEVEDVLYTKRTTV